MKIDTLTSLKINFSANKKQKFSNKKDSFEMQPIAFIGDCFRIMHRKRGSGVCVDREDNILREFTEIDTRKFLKYDKNKLVKITPWIYIPKRKEQFSAEEMECLAKLSEAEVQNAKERKLLTYKYVTQSDPVQELSGKEIANFASLNNNEWGQAKYILEKRRFAPNDICNFILEKEKNWDKTIERGLLEKKIFKKDIPLCHVPSFSLMDKKSWAKAQRLLNSFVPMTVPVISQISSLDDEKWERINKRGLLEKNFFDNNYLNAFEIKDFASLNEEEWQNVKVRNLLKKEKRWNSKISFYAKLNDEDYRIAKTICSKDVHGKYTLLNEADNFKIAKNMLKKGISNTLILDILEYDKRLKEIEDFKTLSFDEKTFLIAKLKWFTEELKSDMLEILKEYGFDFCDNLEQIKKSLGQTVTPTEKKNEDKINFLKTFLAINNEEAEETLKNFDFSKFKQEGIPLKYPRKAFLRDFNLILKKESDKEELFKKLEISPKFDGGGEIEGYDGIIRLDKLDKNLPVFKIANRFIKENEVRTGDKSVDNVLNSLVKGMPEFVNVIGKKQHGTHDYSVDIHIFEVLKGCLNNPDYQKLSPLEKTVLKASALFHDIAKSEGVIDKKHPLASAFYVKDILKDSLLPQNIQDRIFDTIKNHHWLEEYGNKRKDAHETAVELRKSGNYEMLKIISEADLKAVQKSGAFYDRYGFQLDEDFQKPIKNAVRNINKWGIALFSDKILYPNKIPEKNYEGRNFKVIDLSEQNFVPEKCGFAKDADKNDLTFAAHMLSGQNLGDSLNALGYLCDPSNNGILSVSLVSLKRNRTYGHREFGVILDYENQNISNAYKENIGSGIHKEYNDFVELLREKSTHSLIRESRENFSKSVKEYLKINDEEYADLYEKIMNFNFLSQIKDDDLYSAGDKKIKGNELKKALLEARNSLFAEEDIHNEIVIYNPRIKGIISKEKDFDKIPSELLDFAYINHLPVIILPKY